MRASSPDTIRRNASAATFGLEAHVKYVESYPDSGNAWNAVSPCPFPHYCMHAEQNKTKENNKFEKNIGAHFSILDAINLGIYFNETSTHHIFYYHFTLF